MQKNTQIINSICLIKADQSNADPYRAVAATGEDPQIWHFSIQLQPENSESGAELIVLTTLDFLSALFFDVFYHLFKNRQQTLDVKMTPSRSVNECEANAGGTHASRSPPCDRSKTCRGFRIHINICNNLAPWRGEKRKYGFEQRRTPPRAGGLMFSGGSGVGTWLPPLFGLTKTKTGFIRGEGSGFRMNGRHLDSLKRKKNPLI